MIFATIVGLALVYIYFRQKRDEKIALEEEEERRKQISERMEKKLETTECVHDNLDGSTTQEEVEPGTKGLAYRVLRQIGCEPKDAEDDRVVFDFQGITFLMEVTDECKFVNLIWPWCHSFSKFDIDEFARVRRVVNDINARGTASVFYGITDSDDVAIHIKKHFLLVPQIPDLEGYMKLMLDSFFRTARTLDVEIEKCRLQECGR